MSTDIRQARNSWSRGHGTPVFLMKARPGRLILILILALFGPLYMIHGKASQEAGGSPRVLVTTVLIEDVVRNICGDLLSVKSLLDYGQDPHGYVLTPRDMADVERADILFVNGFGLEEHILESIEHTAVKKLVEVSAGIRPIRSDGTAEGDHDEHSIDPHTWTSPLNVLQWADNIAVALARVAPEHKAVFMENAEVYKNKLREVHLECETQFASIPPARKLLITDHDAMGYFARDYGFRIVGNIVPSVSTNSDVSTRHLSGLIGTIEEHDIRAVFVSSNASQETMNLVEMLKKDISAPVTSYTLLTGSLQPAGMEGHTYIELVRYNAGEIMKAFSSG